MSKLNDLEARIHALASALHHEQASEHKHLVQMSEFTEDNSRMITGGIVLAVALAIFNFRRLFRFLRRHARPIGLVAARALLRRIG